MVDIMKQSVVYVFKLSRIPYENVHLSEAYIHYNGREVFISRILDIRELLSHEMMEPENEAEIHSTRDSREEEEVEEEEEIREFVETHLDVFIAPQPSISLYSLCRQFVLKLCPIENDLAKLPIPSRVKNDLINIRKYYKI